MLVFKDKLAADSKAFESQYSLVTEDLPKIQKLGKFHILSIILEQFLKMLTSQTDCALLFAKMMNNDEGACKTI